MDMDDLLNTAEAARALGISRERVRVLIVEKRLPARKVGRDWTIQRVDLRAVIERRPGRPRRGMLPASAGHDSQEGEGTAAPAGRAAAGGDGN
jgi:excisionase family DNA binding protein